MRYDYIITKENFSDIEKMMAETKRVTEERAEKDCFSDYSESLFAIIGERAVEEFSQKYNIEIKWVEAPLKLDKNTTAKLVPCVLGNYYYSLRSGGGFDGLVQNVRKIVEYEGVLFDWWCTKNRCTFFLFNDNSDYTNYLPYNWFNDNPEPERVGVVTDKKMIEWKKWLVARRNATAEERAKRERTVYEFLQRIEEIDRNKILYKKIEPENGEVIANGLRLYWTIKSGIIHRQLEIYYTTTYSSGYDIIDAFKAMIDGKCVCRVPPQLNKK